MNPEEAPYLTIESPCEGLFKAKGSKHFGYVFPIDDVNQVKDRLEELRLLHPSARHHAFAYRLGNQGENWRANDDGEPNNSAGPPILGALRSHNLTHCMGVVVRYFGGTKLGVGGLIEAYREATNEAIAQGAIVERHPIVSMTVVFPYNQLGPVMSLLKRQQLTPFDPDFQLTCTMRIEMRKSVVQAFLKALLVIPGVRLLPRDI
jgi:uncharacterized YigZ family protein